MTSGRYLLDTGIVAFSLPRRRRRPRQDRRLRGDLRQQQDELEKIGEFAQVVRVLDCDADTAEVYGRIKTALRVKGRPIPEMDIWIAATAMQHELSLAMRDSHFEQVDGLTFASW